MNQDSLESIEKSELFIFRCRGDLSLAKKRAITNICGKNSLEMTEPPDGYVVRTFSRLAAEVKRQFEWILSVEQFNVLLVTVE